MGISRISDLFAANVDSVYQARSNPQAQSTSTQSEPQSSEAVTFSAGISSQGGSEASDAAVRQQRVQQLKAQVRSDQYSVPKEKVAEAIYRDLV